VLIITKQGIEKLIDRLSAPDELERCRYEVRKLLEIESDLLWWAESGKCCRWQAGAYLTGRTQLLEEVLSSIDKGDTARASSLLREYTNQLLADGEGITLS
jgi:hypothetical protein